MDAQSRIKELVSSACQSVMQKKKKDSLRILLTTPTQIQMHMCRLLYLFWGVVSWKHMLVSALLGPLVIPLYTPPLHPLQCSHSVIPCTRAPQTHPWLHSAWSIGMRDLHLHHLAALMTSEDLKWVHNEMFVSQRNCTYTCSDCSERLIRGCMNDLLPCIIPSLSVPLKCFYR